MEGPKVETRSVLFEQPIGFDFIVIIRCFGLQSLEVAEGVSRETRSRPSHYWMRWVKAIITLKVKHLAFGSGLMRHATVKSLVQ